MKFLSVLFSSFVLLVGCVSGPSTRDVVPDLEYKDYPVIGQEATAEIGDTLVLKSKLYTYDGLELMEAVTDGGSNREYIVDPHKMPLVKVDEGGRKYFKPDHAHYYVQDKMFGQIVPMGNGYFVVSPDNEASITGYYDMSSAGPLTNPYPHMKIGKIVDERKPNFRQELLYNGKVGTAIKLTYREYSNDMIRTAFSQEVQYDLSESKLVGFRGVRIEILEASNMLIRYRVLKSFPVSD
ncbi:MAG: hypothetical protein ACC700_18875 [Anaerolineales bacterium]